MAVNFDQLQRLIREVHRFQVVGHSADDLMRAAIWAKAGTYREVRRRYILALTRCKNCERFRMDHMDKKCLFEPTVYDPG
jgi:hypothetical protein